MRGCRFLFAAQASGLALVLAGAANAQVATGPAAPPGAPTAEAVEPSATAAPAAISSGSGSAAPAALIASDADIVVTAQRRSQRLQDVPVAVSVVTGATLDRTNITTLESISARLPAVKIVSGPLVDYLNIRGIGSGQNAGFEQSVGTFVDGIYRGRSKSTRAALFDVDQVEILKGPQTTFFGNNTIAGALNITTRKPTSQWVYNASALYAFEDGEYNVEGGAGGPITDTLGIRLAGRVSGLNGYIDNVATGRDAPHNRDALGRISLRWEPTNSFRSDFRFDIGRNRGRDAVSAIAINCPSPYAKANDFACGAIIADNGGPTGSGVTYKSYAPANFANFNFHEAELTNSLDLGAVSLTSISGYFHQDFHQLVYLVPSTVQFIPGYSLAFSPAAEHYTTYSQELRLQSKTGGVLEYMVGGYYSHEKLYTEADFGENFIPVFGPVGGLSQDHFRNRTLSAFASATIRPFDGLRINLGARYTDVRKFGTRYAAFGTPSASSKTDFNTNFTLFPIGFQRVLAGIFGTDLQDYPSNVRDDHRFLPSAGLQYDLAQNVMAYVTYTRGFKSGGYSASNTASIYGPESVNAYEVGIKSTLFDRRLTLNADVFRSDYRNIQETTITFPGGIPVSSVTNAAASRAQGVEANASLRITPNLTLSTDLAYLDSTYQDYTNGVCTMAQTFSFVPTASVPACFQDLSGKRRPYSPKWSGNIGASASAPLGDYVLRVDPLFYFTSAFFTTAQADPLVRQKGFAKVDLRVGFGPTNQRWEVAVVGKNLTDKKTASYRNPLTGGNGSVFALPDRPRAIALQFSIKG